MLSHCNVAFLCDIRDTRSNAVVGPARLCALTTSATDASTALGTMYDINRTNKLINQCGEFIFLYEINVRFVRLKKLNLDMILPRLSS